MRTTILSSMFVCLFVSTGFASYTYEVYTYGSSHTLHDEETILVDLQGGMFGLTLFKNSYADIKGTSILGQGTGGIEEIDLIGNSSLTMSGGQVHELNPHDNTTMFLAGGLIQQIKSSQGAWKQVGDPPVWVPNPHVTIECSDHFYDDTTNLLTGHWLDDGSAFSIYLIDVDGYSPAIQNIQFIPEPATLLLFGLGGLALRKRSIR